MTLKRDTKFGEELTCSFKIDIKNLTNFDWAVESLKNVHFNGLLLRKLYIWAKKYRGVIFHGTEKGYKISRGIDMSFRNWHKEFHKFWPEHSKVSKMFTLMGSFWAKYILLELKITEKLSFTTLKKDAKFEEKLTCSLENEMRNTLLPKLGVPCSKPLGGLKVDSSLHPSGVDKMSTMNFWELCGKK